MRYIWLITTLYILAQLSACGFQPVHSKNSSNNANSRLIALEEVKIDMPIEGRIGQIFRTALEDTFHPENIYPTPRYRLFSNLEEIKQPIIIERDARITRYNLIFRANYKLIDINNGSIISNKVSQRIVSYNVSESDFATFIAHREARQRGLKELARTMAMEIVAILPEQK